MKIALCFSGQVRSFEKGYDYYKRNLLDHYDVDVYIHGWKMPNGEKALLQLFNPKDYLFEDKLVGNYNSIYTEWQNCMVIDQNQDTYLDNNANGAAGVFAMHIGNNGSLSFHHF